MSRYWGRYIPVAERRRNALREMDLRFEAGESAKPVLVQGRIIAKSFWGRAWCEQVESFGDISNRLQRGKTYVRNGSVCHLNIFEGRVEGMVAGSEVYDIKLEIKPLKQKDWEAIQERCAGKIDSLLQLLNGKLSEAVLHRLTDPEMGLLPKRSEIHYRCNCPDGASMCKHIAAVVYGVGARLDESPELLFILRGVRQEELIQSGQLEKVLEDQAGKSTRRRLNHAQQVFGFAVEKEEPPEIQQVSSAKVKRESNLKKNTSKRASSSKAFLPTPTKIKRLRRKVGLNQKDFASMLGVSALSVSKWENATGSLTLRKGLIKLEQLWYKHML